MELAAGLFLVACAAAGFGITYLSGVGLNLEERITFGAVLGPMAVAAASYVISLLVRDVTWLTVLAGLVLGAGAGVAGLVAGWAQVGIDLVDARRRWLAPLRAPDHPWPFALVTLVCAAWTVHFLHQAYVYTPSGLYTGYVNIWGDWAAHLSFAGSFAYGNNFPPAFPIDPGHHLGYPFMIDFFAADLIPFGISLTEALTATSGMLGLAFPAVLYLAARRFAGGRLAAAIAVFVFLLSGGLGFGYFFIDVSHNGFAAAQHLMREYTLNRNVNLQWLNPVLAYLIPQRSTLFGFSLALIVLLVLWLAVRDRAQWKTFVFAGLVAGVMPVFHVHAYGTVVALGLFWALMFDRRRQWQAFFVPAIVIGVPILVWMWPPQNTSVCGDLPSIDGYCIQPGWLAFSDWQAHGWWLFAWDFIWFWIWNASLLLPVLIAAQIASRWLPTDFAKWFAPMWLWFVVPNIVILQPWVWDNTKFFVFWLLIGSILAGALIARMLVRGPATAIAAVFVLGLLCFSGALDLTRASDFSVSYVQFTDTGGLKVAEWIRHNTKPDALFVVADDHNSPVPTLAGRRELIGYPGWLWTYGLADYVQKGADNRKILDGDPATPELVRKYGVDYVMIGPQEIPQGASRAYWDLHGTLVYTDGVYSVYRVNLPGA
ncbi:MAG TPA: hypothetical protein VN906_06755 [Candidatus Sulfotelmatobacter sp.]|nr:hypothetical protein [Candidatus Sulfotelmatobacter sp.]